MESQIVNCMDYFSGILKLMKSSNQYEQTLHLVVDRVVRLFRAQTCAVVLIDPHSEYLNIENSLGLSYTFCKAFRRKVAVGAIGEVLWTGKPILLTNALDDLKIAQDIQLEHPFECCACVQIAIDNRSLGYLYVDSRETNAFAKTDIPVLQAFADLAGVAINKARLHDENLRLNTVDADTGLEKYSAFLRHLQAGMDRAQQYDEHFAVLLLDVDNYKTILDTFGYETANKFLRELGALARSELRSIDACGRYGFDEFIVMLSRMEMENAIDFAQKLCRKVEATEFVSNSIKTTISVGVSTFPQNGKTMDDLLQTAKQALFEAQRAGRNNVFFYPAEWYASEGVMHR
ncbi:MAG: GGDEF domain-containing protein [Ignavibacteriae bacterium]|nr:GGDEF domain-containing protein [Ignavibacteriota bacterium]